LREGAERSCVERSIILERCRSCILVERIRKFERRLWGWSWVWRERFRLLPNWEMKEFIYFGDWL
jgi:hypothetical protein